MIIMTIINQVDYTTSHMYIILFNDIAKILQIANFIKKIFAFLNLILYLAKNVFKTLKTI